MTKKQRIYSMLFDNNELPLIYTGAGDSGCRSTQICRAHRLEHPHCAFFKREMELKGMNVLRRTLYTTDNWLHTDYQIMPDSSFELIKKYIRNENDLKSLYFYLTDVSVNGNADYDPPKNAFHIYPITMLPLEQCMDVWMGESEYKELLLCNDQLLKKCFYHMAQITTEEARIISSVVKEGSASVIDMGDFMLECMDAEYVQWRIGFIKKIKKITHIPVMVHIKDARPDLCARLSDTGADIVKVSLKQGGMSAAGVMESSGSSFTILDIDGLDEFEPLKNIDIKDNGAFVSSDIKKLDKLRFILQN